MAKPTSNAQSVHSGYFQNFFGTLGYLSLVIQWGWSFLALIYPTLESGDSFIFPRHTTTPPTPSSANPPELSPLIIFISLAVTAVILVMSIIIISRIPKTIGKRGAGLAHSAANALIPVITHHQPIAQKKRLVLSFRLVLLVKLIVIILPLAALMWLSTKLPIDRQVIWLVALYLACGSVIWFALQYLVAYLMKTPKEDVW